MRYAVNATPGGHELDDQRVIRDVRVFTYKFSDADANHKISFPLEGGLMVVGVGHLVTAAFAGGTPTIDIGDGTTPAFFIANAAIAETTLNDFAFKDVPKYIITGGAVVVTLSSGLTAGAGKVLVESFTLKGDWRLPDL